MRAWETGHDGLPRPLAGSQIARVIAADWRIAPPPYVLPCPSFRFPALAALAGRAALGGEREVALGCFLAARLAQDAVDADHIPESARRARAAGARLWLSTLAVPPTPRAKLLRLVEASLEPPVTIAEALRDVIDAAAFILDVPARAELERLVRALVL